MPDTMKQGAQFLPGPTPSEHGWHAAMQLWRTERRFRLGFTPTEYERADLAWTQSSFVQTQMMVEDRYFYDPTTQRYTVDRYLDDLIERYGGIDSVLIWPTYPNIGVDGRNQFDWWRSLPEGLAGLRGAIADFHRRGVRVFLPVMPWDHGTRDEGASIWETLATLLRELDADGLNGDTLFGVPWAFRQAAEQTHHPLALEPENGLEGGDALAWNTASWGYWEYPFVPVVSAYKWMESRHMVHLCRRWGRDKTDDLQHAFFNGVGYVAWENVWGMWNGITPRDGEALRRIAMIERHFAPLFTQPAWEPHVPTLQFGVFASCFPADDARLWTLVNRNSYPVEGPQLAITVRPGERYFDLWHGVELLPDGAATLAFALEGRGFGAILATRGEPPQHLLDSARTAAPLATYAATWQPLPQQLIAIPQTARFSHVPDGMIALPAHDFTFQVTSVIIEGEDQEGIDVQYPWEASPRRRHHAVVPITPIAIDRYPVTNAQFQAFLAATGYQPADDAHFLQDWINGHYPEGWAERPVTWVSLEDARAYAAWAGKRLPHEWEWQYAAQGTDGRRYPWGDTWDDARVPPPDTARSPRAPTAVNAYPTGVSPFGVADLVGNIWQWTDEFTDVHTRGAIVRGGSYYQPQGSGWYFPQSYRLDQHSKLLLMAPGRDRSALIGFRCVVDMQG